MAILAGCEAVRQSDFVGPMGPPMVASEPLVRVRTAHNVSQIQVVGPGRVRFRPLASGSIFAGATGDTATFVSTPAIVRRTADAFQVEQAGGIKAINGASAVVLQAESGDTITVDGVVYPGWVALHAINDGSGGERFDVVNHTTVERYLPGVLDRELFPDWHLTTYAVQAIAARSYTAAQIRLHPDRHYDLEATEASQVYGGHKASAKARDAVTRTRGVVLVFQGQVFPAYYSSCCGGLGQDAAVAFEHTPAIPPLSARSHGKDCEASPNRRWGPIMRHRADLAQRIASWGRAHRHPIAGLQGIASIVVVARNAVGRPAKFAIVDEAGQTFELPAESFRFACNYAGGGLQPLPKEVLLKSSNVNVAVSSQWIRFDGSGYGHGVGLCQWGAQGLAQRGYDPYAILGFYYPGAKLRRWYW